MKKKAPGWDRLVRRMDGAYGDGMIAQVDGLTAKDAPEEEFAALGDGLAVFIVREAGDVSTGCETREETYSEVAHALRRAIMELEAVIEGIERG